MRKPEQRPSVKPPHSWIFPEPARHWLDNGVQVLAAHRPGQHVAAVSLVLDIPLSVEAADREGLATITQRCLDEGTQAHPGPRFTERLEDIGAVLGGAAGYSATELGLEVPVAELGPALRLLAEAVTQPELSVADVDRHRQLRLAEIEQIHANSAQRAQLAFRAACVPSRFRAARPAGGAAETVANVDAAAVTAFHRRYYRPEGASLVISGDLDADAFELAADAFGGWMTPGVELFQHQVPVSRRPHLWLIDRPGAVQADVRLGGFGVDRSDPRWADVQVGCHALGGAFLSRLNAVLREEHGFTYGVHLVNQPMRDGGLLAMQGSFRTDVVAEALDLARGLLDLTHRPISAAEVTDAVTYLNGVAPLRYSTAHGVTEQISTLLAAGLSAEFINAHAQALAMVTPESATQAMTELLPPDEFSLVVVGDADALVDPLTAAGWPVRVRS